MYINEKELKNYSNACQLLEEERMGSCLMDMEFQFEKMKKFCWWMVVRL
jgi:hypothetical protein